MGNTVLEKNMKTGREANRAIFSLGDLSDKILDEQVLEIIDDATQRLVRLCLKVSAKNIALAQARRRMVARHR